MCPSSSGSDLTPLLADGSDRRLKAFVATAEQLGSDGKGKGGLVGYMMFRAKEDPAQFSIWLNKVNRAQIRRRYGRRRPPPPRIHDTLVSDAIVKAAELLGSDGKGRGGADGFLTTYARKRPRQFSKLIDSVVDAECAPGGPLEQREEANRRIASDRFFRETHARAAMARVEDAEDDQAE